MVRGVLGTVPPSKTSPEKLDVLNGTGWALLIPDPMLATEYSASSVDSSLRKLLDRRRAANEVVPPPAGALEVVDVLTLGP